ncbi:uncharacterized protein LOC124366913 [Homalodisca vitripennis]|uniref:uncharacterized protein LOC124366913 n=2 Tax=Homalodisca vitripennis TaxID=197043 RepID=UPI001EE9DAF2|nr:uncharacterized protein LOC124366913 [Homalodisca vitripennis]
MKICYLPIFMAVAATVILGISAQNVRVARQLDLTPLTDMVGLMGMIMSMMVPTEVSSMFTDSFGQVFSAVPVDFSSLTSLVGLGRKRRAVYPWQARVKKIMNELERVEKMLDGMPKVPEDPEFSFDQGLVGVDDRVGTDETPVPFFYRDELNRRFARSPDSDSEGDSGADMQSKAMETAMKGATIAEKGFEGGKMAANAGSDLAKSGKAGAEGAAAGAEMLSGAAETISAGAGQGQQMAGSFSG